MASFVVVHATSALARPTTSRVDHQVSALCPMQKNVVRSVGFSAHTPSYRFEVRAQSEATVDEQTETTEEETRKYEWVNGMRQLTPRKRISIEESEARLAAYDAQRGFKESQGYLDPGVRGVSKSFVGGYIDVIEPKMYVDESAAAPNPFGSLLSKLFGGKASQQQQVPATAESQDARVAEYLKQQTQKTEERS